MAENELIDNLSIKRKYILKERVLLGEIAGFRSGTRNI